MDDVLRLTEPGGVQTFLQAFLERAAGGHRFAEVFHLRGQREVGLREFLEGEAYARL